jgi:3-hydroxyanthranilate 3,4-dioxygenase
MAVVEPFDFKEWISENRHLLKPPVGAKRVYPNADFIVMVVGGPNQRTDYHVDPGEEFFYQLEGDMVLKIVDDGEFKDILIKEGQIFLLPANVPHSPQRFENTVGLVIERNRMEGEKDGLQWYCSKCGDVVYADSFICGNLPKQIAEVMAVYGGSKALRTCGSCGYVNEL